MPLMPPRFPHQPLDLVAVDSPPKPSLGHAECRLRRNFCGQVRLHNFHQDRPSLQRSFSPWGEQRVQQLFRLQSIRSRELVPSGVRSGVVSGLVSGHVIRAYFPEMYCSMAIVMDGAFGVGAAMSTLNLLSFAAFSVVGPKVAMHVVPCSKSGKFLNKLSMPLGL